MLEKRKVKEDTIKLVADQIYDKITNLINGRRKKLGIKVGSEIPIRDYDGFNLDDNDNLTFVH